VDDDGRGWDCPTREIRRTGNFQKRMPVVQEGKDSMICGICNSEEFSQIPVKEFTGGQPLHVCMLCGLVQVLERRSSEELYEAWQGAEPSDLVFKASAPAVAARHAFVGEFLVINDMLLPQDCCIDVGSGDGSFGDHCWTAYDKTVGSWDGRAEDLEEGEDFDIATVLWTLENCADINTFLQGCKRAIKPDGKIVVATGSRILVPFKKPLHMYLDKSPMDMHPWRFSFNTLRRALIENGLRVVTYNRYIDSDYLVVVAEPWKGVPKHSALPRDIPLDVINFFSRWERETRVYYS